jgi:hypothetical protein
MFADKLEPVALKDWTADAVPASVLNGVSDPVVLIVGLVLAVSETSSKPSPWLLLPPVEKFHLK